MGKADSHSEMTSRRVMVGIVSEDNDQSFQAE